VLQTDRHTAFDGEQYDKAYPEGVERHFWHLARTPIIARTLRRADLGSGRLLEIGCGRGVVVEGLRNLGFDCTGCELAPVAVPPRLQPHVESGRDATALPDKVREDVSAILLLDVIEHLPDPVSWLSTIRHRFPRLQGIVVTVPARAELWSAWDDYYGHYRRYDRRMLTQQLTAAGYAVDRMQYFFHGLYLPAWIAARLRRARKVEIAPPTGGFAHRLLAWIFRWEARLVPGGIPGSSIIAVARPLRE
jgi:hypothetical protein